MSPPFLILFINMTNLTIVSYKNLEVFKCFFKFILGIYIILIENLISIHKYNFNLSVLVFRLV